MLYIIDTQNFKGQIENTMSNGYVHYSDKPTTLEEYKSIENNPNLIALGWDDFCKKYYTPYLNGLCKPFKEITKDDWWEALECLPPLNWTKNKDKDAEFFFVDECYTADLYYCYVRIKDKYYSALRPYYTKSEDIFSLNQI